MAGAETTVERLRKFLRELSPGARSLLVGELERRVLADFRSASDRNRINPRSRAATAAAAAIARNPAKFRCWIQMKLLKSRPWSSSWGSADISPVSWRSTKWLNVCWRNFDSTSTTAHRRCSRLCATLERLIATFDSRRSMRQCVSAPKYSGANMPLCWGSLQRSPQPQSPRPSAPETRRFSPHCHIVDLAHCGHDRAWCMPWSARMGWSS